MMTNERVQVVPAELAGTEQLKEPVTVSLSGVFDPSWMLPPI